MGQGQTPEQQVDEFIEGLIYAHKHIRNIPTLRQ